MIFILREKVHIMEDDYCLFCGKKISNEQGKIKELDYNICDECLKEWRHTYPSKRYQVINFLCISVAVIINIIFFLFLLYFFKYFTGSGVFLLLVIFEFVVMFILPLTAIIYYNIKK